jgi:hypothetical protein
MEASHRVRAGRELLKAGMSKRNYNDPWVHSVVTFLHKNVFKRQIRLDRAGQYTNKPCLCIALCLSQRVGNCVRNGAGPCYAERVDLELHSPVQR